MKNVEIVKQYGSYEMKLRPFLKHDNKGNVITETSSAQISIYDKSQLRFPLLKSIKLTLIQAWAAMDLFESIGYIDIKVND